MDVNERTLLLPSSRSANDIQSYPNAAGQRPLSCLPSTTKYVLLFTTLPFLILVIFLTQGDCSSSTSKTSVPLVLCGARPTNSSTTQEDEDHDYDDSNFRMDQLARSTIDELVDLWSYWIRAQFVSSRVESTDDHSNKPAALFHAHLSMANQIIGWEARQHQSETEEFLERAVDTQLEDGTSHIRSLTTKVRDKVQHEGEQSFEIEASEQWETFVKHLNQTHEWSVSVNKTVDEAQNDGEFSNISSVLLDVESEPWWDDMADWFRRTWTAHAEDAHHLWLQLKDQDDRVHLWNLTAVDNEQLWYGDSITNMRKLGMNMRQWWSGREGPVGEEEKIIHANFTNWWSGTSEHGRLWWKHSRQAFADFSKVSSTNKLLWWHMLQQAAQHGWDKTAEVSQNAWDEVELDSALVWNATEEEVILDSKEAWNATVETEENMWQKIRNWFHAHATYTEELKQPLFYLNNTPAFGMLMNGYGWFDYSIDFYHLQRGWDAQINQAYCGVASSAAVLNSLQGLIELPIDPRYDPYPYATQNGILETNSVCINEHVVRYNETFNGIRQPPGGLSLEQTKKLIECHLLSLSAEFQVTAHFVDPMTLDLDQVRSELMDALQDPSSRVIVNFDRKAFGQVGEGHFSPLASYNAIEDRFLILDVAKYKYPSVWVTAAQLVASMATIDYCGESAVPKAQDSLEPCIPNCFYNETEYMKRIEHLGCQPKYRGYILVRPNKTASKTSL
ncbi:hypothetical protein ACA910_022282 [Epithemia clementina (nom. ined.)]